MATNDSFSSRPPSSKEHAPAWQLAYEAVISETDTEKLFKRVEVAEAACRTRLAELEGSADHYVERQVLEKAVAHLQVVKRERLKFL
jgi:hypothetical protein